MITVLELMLIYFGVVEMTGKAHLCISAFLCQIFAMIFFKDFTPIPLIIGGICGLLADIDEDQSKIAYLLIKGIGGKKRIKNVNYHKTDVKHNARIKLIRRIFLSLIVSLIGLFLFFVLKLSIFFTLALFYVAVLPWTKHRSLSHSLLSTTIIGGLTILGMQQYGLLKYGVYITVGYFLHIFEDMFTVSGVPLLYPFSKKRFKIPLMSTGTSRGALVEMVFIVISIILCIYTYISLIL